MTLTNGKRAPAAILRNAEPGAARTPRLYWFPSLLLRRDWPPWF